MKKLLAKLAALSLPAKVTVALVTVAVVSGALIFGLKHNATVPVNQDPQGGQQQQQQVQQEQQQLDDILDVKDTKGGVKGALNKIIDTVTGEETTEKADKKPVIRYVVKFETNGGGEISDKSVVAGTKISKLPTPKRDGYIFLGWYYDDDLTQAVKLDDTVNKKMTLYASWLEQTPLETLERVNFAAAENVGKDFTIKVLSSDSSMTAEDVKAAIIAQNLTNPAVTDFIKVTADGNGFVISGVKHSEGVGTSAGFEEGSTYTIKLDSEALTFEGYDASVREFNFTTDKEEVLNLKLNSDITFIPVSDLSNITNGGETVETLDIALYTVGNDGAMSAADLTSGTFVYTKGTLNVGQVVSVYDGLIPTERTLGTPADQLGDIGYVEITGVNGNKYSYTSAQAEDVIFTPDMLPMPVDADLDTTDGAVLTVEDKYFDYSDDFYFDMDLDSQTKVDVGDYLVFYTGDLAVTIGENAATRIGFAEITAVTKNDNGTTTVEYKGATWDEVDSSMDVYTQDEITADELLEGLNKEEIEAEIEQQAMDSGFAEEAAQYLASLALATENFTKLSDNMNLEDYKVVLEDGTPVTPEQLSLMNNGISAQVADTQVKATVSKKPQHLGNVAGTNADKSGIALSLEVTSVISIEAEDGELEITVTGKFVEELGFDYGASSDTEWDWWGIIPYISEWTVSANLDLINYTGLEITATMITKEAEDDGDILNTATDIADQIKEMLESSTNAETGEEYQNKLIEKYSEMVHADSDWIRIVEINIFEFDKRLPPCLPIIHLEVSVDFVIQMDASVAVGFEFEYLEGKRYIFNVRITEGKVTNSEVSLKEKTYELCFYTMGRVALKAGIELEFKVGLFSTKLANIGFDAGAGPYTKLYGYFYYELKYAQSAGRTQQYSGALLTQVGVYFHLGLNAEALGGRYSSSVDLVDKEWLLWEAGRRDNVLDFNTEQEDMPEMVMRQFVRRVQLPDSVFNMLYLDLITGDGKTAIYNDWNDPAKQNDFRNGANYQITITNDKFAYDPVSNEITVDATDKDIKIEGEMIITWKNKPMSFSSKPIQRRIKLYWDNLRDGYMIVPYTNGGSYIPIIMKGYEAKITAPADPTKLGYNFAGWYSDAEFTVPYTFPERMPNDDTEIYAKWEARIDIPYTVEHYLENFQSGEYEIFEVENFEGTTDTTVATTAKNYEGYITPSAQTVKVEADGSGILRYYYKLHRSTVTFVSGIEGKDNIVYNLKYGASIVAPQMSAKGYTFMGWTTDGTNPAEITKTMGTDALSYTAMWQKNPDTEYRVEYYVQQADGSYKLQHFFTEKDYTGGIVSEARMRQALIDGATADEKYTVIVGTDANGEPIYGVIPSNMTVKGEVCNNGEAIITADGRLVVKINYARAINPLTFDPAYDGAQPIENYLYYQQAVQVPENPTRVGYTFAGWDDVATAEEVAVTPTATMAAVPVTYKALWTPNTDTKYTVKHYKQNVDNLEEYTLADTDNLEGTTATDVTPVVKEYTGFTAPAQQTATIAADGSMVVEYRYTRNSYTIALNANNGAFKGETDENGNPVAEKTLTFLYEEPITIPVVERAGYGLTGWFKDVTETSEGTQFTSGTMPAENLDLTAKWEAGKIAYTVKHYQQNIGGGDNYTLVKTENGTADMDSTVTPAVYTYTGFTSPESQTITIGAEAENNVVEYRYTRDMYTVTWDLNGGAANASYTSGDVYFGQAITKPVPEIKGHSYFWDDLATEEETAVNPITVMGTENVSYKAIWAPNDYIVRFDLGGGSVVTPEGETPISTEDRAVTYGTEYGALAEIEKNGYTFNGWFTAKTGGVQVTADTILDNDANHTLYAQYTLITHPISYKFIDTRTGAEIADVDNTANLAYHSVENHTATLADCSKLGYTFDGWYLGCTTTENGDAVNVEFAEAVSGEVDFMAEQYNGKTFYAKLVPGQYTINFVENTGTDKVLNPVKVYFGENVDLEYYSTTIANSKAGYTLIGWTTAENGTEAQYATDAKPMDIATDSSVTLYAVWNVNTYTITYNMGKYANETSDAYPKEYTVETAEDITLPTPKAQANFAFGGWYTDKDYTNPISKIAVKDAKTNYTLYAKWEHPGEFSIEQTKASGYEVTFTVTREIPDGAVGTSETQNVYVRTQNGTAYGTTVDSTGQDKYHFIHNYAVLEFGPKDTSKTFTVTEKDGYLSNDIPASYRINDTRRFYYAEIYKIENNAGNLAGTIDTEKAKATRTMPLDIWYKVEDIYKEYTATLESGEVKIYSSKTYSVTPSDLILPADDGYINVDSYRKQYLESLKINDKFGYRVSMDLNMGYSGKPTIQLYTGISIWPESQATYEVNPNLMNNDYVSVSFPTNGKITSETFSITETLNDRCEVYTLDDKNYIRIDKDKECNVELDYHLDSSYKARNIKMHAVVIDTEAPKVQCAAPLATTAYKAGEKAYITVIYNEPINFISGTPTLKLLSELTPYFKQDAKYVDAGAGTNALVFEVEAVKDITADEIQDIINGYLVGDFTSNVALTASVTDYCGNK